MFHRGTLYPAPDTPTELRQGTKPAGNARERELLRTCSGVAVVGHCCYTNPDKGLLSENDTVEVPGSSPVVPTTKPLVRHHV